MEAQTHFILLVGTPEKHGLEPLAHEQPEAACPLTRASSGIGHRCASAGSPYTWPRRGERAPEGALITHDAPMMTKPMDLSGNHEHTGRADTPEAQSDAAVCAPPPRRKTILVVSDKYPPHAVGGAEISLHLQLKRIDPATFDIRVAVLDKQRPEPGATEDEYSHDNVRVRRIGKRR